MIAPQTVEFYASDWAAVGTKLQRVDEIQEITGIPSDVLVHRQLGRRNAAERLSWAAHRRVSREEDSAYSLLGLFRVNMPMLYGEGSKSAFRRLQQEIFRFEMDHTIFLYTMYDDGGPISLLAEDVSQFCQIKQCNLHRRYNAEFFQKKVPYKSLGLVSPPHQAQLFGVGQITQELVYTRWTVFAPLRVVKLYAGTHGFPSAKPMTNQELPQTSAVLTRVLDTDGRWICLELKNSNPYDESFLRGEKTFSLDLKELPVQVEEKLCQIYNPSRPSHAGDGANEYQFVFQSQDFDLVHWRLKDDEDDEEDPASQESLRMPGMLYNTQKIHFPMAHARYHRGSRELILWIKFKTQDDPAIVVIIRRLVYQTTPFVHAQYLPNLPADQMFKLNYAVTSDRCCLQLPDGRRILIGLRRKPSSVDGADKARRYEITMVLGVEASESAASI